MKQRLALAALAALIAALPTGAAAYPTKPITMILGFAPGGPSDVMARVLSKKMEEYLKQPIIIENQARRRRHNRRRHRRPRRARRSYHHAGDRQHPRDQCDALSERPV